MSSDPKALFAAVQMAELAMNEARLEIDRAAIKYQKTIELYVKLRTRLEEAERLAEKIG
jgi:exonuclease VII small subunit